jgi:DNA polymerase-3 subunit delta
MLNDKTLKSALDTGSLLPVYIIAGDDIFLKKQALHRVIDRAVDPADEMNLIRFGYGTDLQQVYDELNGFPLMAPKKCVVLSEFDIDGAPKAEFEKLLELAGENYETSVFVLYFGTYEIDFKKSAKFKKLASAVESAGGAVVRLDHKGPDELARILCASAKKKGCLLSPQNADYIISICSQDINFLSNELAKLCAFTKSGEITKEIIDKVCVKSVEASVYDLSVKIINGDTAGAMKLLDQLYFMNIDTVIVFYNISSAFVDMYRAFAAKSAGKNPEALAADFGIPANRAFLLKRAAGNLRKYSERKLELSFDAIIKAEKEIKSYCANSRAAVEKLIVRLIYIMKTGETLD